MTKLIKKLNLENKIFIKKNKKMIKLITLIIIMITTNLEKIIETISKLFAVLLLFTFASCNAQIDSKTLDKNVTEIQSQSNLPGFALSIIKDNKIQFEKGFGFANKETKTPFTSENILPVGSVSKTFIGFSVMKAIDLGYFTMETDINTILPFKIVNPHHPTKIITINSLVTHTSGLIDNEKFYIQAYNEGKKPSLELAKYLKEYYSSNGKFYTKSNFDKSIKTTYNYSNIASALTAYLIEIKANMTFADFTKKYIFEPLQMNNSHWFYDDAFASKYATLYQVDKPDYSFKELENKDGSLKPYSCATYPDGSLKTTTQDLAKYLIEMLKGYEGKSDLLSKSSFETLFKKQFDESTMPLNMNPKEPNRAVFWGYNKKDKLIHTGSDPGLAAFVSIDPKTKISRILLVNTALDGQDNDVTVENFKKIMGEIEKFEIGLK
jgi:CubicO group peptidase (beta-lactamase class C family)